MFVYEQGNAGGKPSSHIKCNPTKPTRETVAQALDAAIQALRNGTREEVDVSMDISEPPRSTGGLPAADALAAGGEPFVCSDEPLPDPFVCSDELPAAAVEPFVCSDEPLPDPFAQSNDLPAAAVEPFVCSEHPAEPFDDLPELPAATVLSAGLPDKPPPVSLAQCGRLAVNIPLAAASASKKRAQKEQGVHNAHAGKVYVLTADPWGEKLTDTLFCTGQLVDLTHVSIMHVSDEPARRAGDGKGFTYRVQQVRGSEPFPALAPLSGIDMLESCPVWLALDELDDEVIVWQGDMHDIGARWGAMLVELVKQRVHESVTEPPVTDGDSLLPVGTSIAFWGTRSEYFPCHCVTHELVDSKGGELIFGVVTGVEDGEYSVMLLRGPHKKKRAVVGKCMLYLDDMEYQYPVEGMQIVWRKFGTTALVSPVNQMDAVRAAREYMKEP